MLLAERAPACARESAAEWECGNAVAVTPKARCRQRPVPDPRAVLIASYALGRTSDLFRREPVYMNCGGFVKCLG
jgi:hypothetical protein